MRNAKIGREEMGDKGEILEKNTGYRGAFWRGKTRCFLRRGEKFYREIVSFFAFVLFRLMNKKPPISDGIGGFL